MLTSVGERVPVWVAVVSVVAAAAQTANQTFIPASSAALHIGTTTVVCGVVGAVRSSRDGEVVDLDGEAPNQGLSVVVPPTVNLGTAARARAKGLQVCATGKIERDRDGAVIKLKDLRSLRAVPGPVARPADFPGTDVLDASDARKIPGMTDPKIRSSPAPKYTSLAMGAAVQGEVGLEAVIRTDGTVGPVRVARSLDALYGLDLEAVRTASTWTFVPAQRDGHPVAVLVTIVMTFRLH